MPSYGATEASRPLLREENEATVTSSTSTVITIPGLTAPTNPMNIEDIVGVVADYLPFENQLIFRLCNQLLSKVVKEKIVIAPPLFQLFKLFLEQGWLKQDLVVKYPIGNIITLPQLALPNGEKIETPRNLVCFLLDPKNISFIEPLKNPVNDFNQKVGKTLRNVNFLLFFWRSAILLTIGGIISRNVSGEMRQTSQ